MMWRMMITCTLLFAVSRQASAGDARDTGVDPRPRLPFIDTRPITLEYREPVPFGYRVVDDGVRWGLIGGGAALFTVPYAMSVGGAADNGWPLYIPAVGPLIQLGGLIATARDECTDRMTAGWCPLVAGVLVTDALAQSAGIAMVVIGILHRKKILVRNDVVGGTASGPARVTSGMKLHRPELLIGPRYVGMRVEF
jgi:hypothetical protein